MSRALTANYYDVVVLGTQPGPLVCASLLARRGFRVLVVGQRTPPPQYRAGPYTLPTSPFTLLAGGLPTLQRILSELALKQRVAGLSTILEPGFQVALPGHRFSVFRESARLGAECEREFPEIKRPIEDFHRALDRWHEQFAELCAKDLMWPPETFFERREFARASSTFAPERRGAGPDLLAELPDQHPFQWVVRAPARFGDGMDPDQQTQLRLASLYAAWRRGAVCLKGGLHGLSMLFVDRIRSASGTVLPDEQVDEIRIRRGGVCAVRMAAAGVEIGCRFVVAGVDLPRLLRLLPDHQLFEELFERVGEPQPRYCRYTLNLVLRSQALPLGMGRDVFFVRDLDTPLAADNCLHLQADTDTGQHARQICVEALLPRRAVEEGEGYLEGARERCLDAVAKLVPFLTDNLLAVDSPHDGRPAQDLTSGKELKCPQPWTRGRASMPILYGYPVTQGLGLCALPVRTPIKQLLLCNGHVVPGLGLEGALLSALSAARVVTRADRANRWIRQGLWTRTEV